MKSVTWTFWARDINGRNKILRMVRDYALNIAEAAAVDGNPAIRIRVSIAGRRVTGKEDT